MRSNAMNALLIYPQLPLSFWSCEISRRIRGDKAIQPPLSLLTVAALLPPQWNLRLVDMNTRPVKESEWLWADIVMSSAMLVQKRGLLDIVSEAKRRGKTIVAGGSYPTLPPQEVLDAGCDYVVKREAENTIQILLNSLTRGERHMIIASTDKPDLSTSPIPRFDLVSASDYSIMGIQASGAVRIIVSFATSLKCSVVSRDTRRVNKLYPNFRLFTRPVLQVPCS